MTKDVLIRISGLQALDGESSDVEVITAGDYFYKNGKHYIVYEEVMEGFEGKVRNTVKITPDILDIRKRGIIGTHMIFERDKKSQTRYATPLGDMVVELATTRIRLEVEEDSLKVAVDYSLGINYQHVSDCSITLDICSRKKAKLQL